jgi:hypothetical protein
VDALFPSTTARFEAKVRGTVTALRAGIEDL